MYNDLFGQPITEAPQKIKGNPCLALYGQGPEGKTCKGCVHLVYRGARRSYLKCDLLKITHGAGTDHKASWPACGKYEEKKAVRQYLDPLPKGSFE